jgi:Ca2+-binding EF-hand superfamily protein
MFLFLQTQTYALASTSALDNSFSKMASQITQGKMTSQNIIDEAHRMVGDAKKSGVTEKEFLTSMSKKLSLNMSEDDVEKTIADLRANPSSAKIQDLASALEKTQSDDKVLMVLLTFALLSALWIGIFFILAAPHWPTH